MEIVQTVGHRQKRIRLLIRVTNNHPLVAHAPQNVIKKHRDTLAFEAVDVTYCKRIVFNEVDM